MENSKCNFVGRNVIGSLAILVIFIAFLLPSQSEAAFIPLSSSSSSSFSSSVSSPSPPSSNSSKKANADKEFEHQVLQLLSHGDKPENIAEDEKLREKILQEISDTAMSIEALEHLLSLARKRVASRRVVRNPPTEPEEYPCTFSTQQVRYKYGYCMAKSGGERTSICSSLAGDFGHSSVCL